MRQLKPAEVAQQLGVSVKTLQRWDNEGIFVAGRTATGRRFYTEQQVDDYYSSQNRMTNQEIRDLKVLYIDEYLETNEFLKSIAQSKERQRQYEVCYSKEKDAFLGSTSSIKTIVTQANLRLEDEAEPQQEECRTLAYILTLSDYLESVWEGLDVSFSYGVGRNDIIEIDLKDQCENALDTILGMQWFFNVDDWYVDILTNTKQTVFDNIIFNLRASMADAINLDLSE